MGKRSQVGLAVLAICTLGVRVSRAETITVQPCGTTPGITVGAYSGRVCLTVSGVMVITPGNPPQDPFYSVAVANPSVAVASCPDCFRFARASTSQCTCILNNECPTGNFPVSSFLVGTYPDFASNHTYSVVLNLGDGSPERLAFGTADCGCGDNSGQFTVAVEPEGGCTTTVPPGPDVDADGVPDAQEACGCLGTASGVPVTALGCTIDQACPCAAPIGRSHWTNHGDYVRCVKGTAREIEGRGVLPVGNGKQIVRAAGRSACGR